MLLTVQVFAPCANFAPVKRKINMDGFEDHVTLQPFGAERPPRPCVVGESDCLANRDRYPSQPPAGLPVGESDYLAKGEVMTTDG